MNSAQNLKVVELRNYLIKPGERDRFIKYFASHFVNSQNELDGYVLGQFTVKDDADKFFWMRGFADMESRLAFLRDFYEQGAVWKKFGAKANEMMLDSDDVYLIRPLNDSQNVQGAKSQSINISKLEAPKKIVTVDLHFAKDNRLDQLINFFQTDYLPFLSSPTKFNETTLWISETAENDFPRLPVIQNDRLLIAISNFESESEYKAKLKEADSATVELKSEMQKLIGTRKSLVLYSV